MTLTAGGEVLKKGLTSRAGPVCKHSQWKLTSHERAQWKRASTGKTRAIKALELQEPDFSSSPQTFTNSLPKHSFPVQAHLSFLLQAADVFWFTHAFLFPAVQESFPPQVA